MAYDARGGRGTGWSVAGAAAGVVLAVVAAFAFMFLGLVALVVVSLASGGFQLGDGDSDVGIDPGKGTASKRLPVTVTPTSALQDGSVVRIRSSAFEPAQVVAVAVCLTTADTKRLGVDACDKTTGARYAVGRNRLLDASYPVPRAIGVGGRTYDCAQRSTSCMVVAASAWDFDQSGGQRISFSAPMGPPRPPPATRLPTDRLPIVPWRSGPLMSGDDLRVTASGFQPGEPVLVATCGPTFATAGEIYACDPRDSNAAVVAVMGDVGSVRDAADRSGTFTTSITLPARIRAYGGRRSRCAKAPGTCSVVIAAAADTKRSAVLPLTVAD